MVIKQRRMVTCVNVLSCLQLKVYAHRPLYSSEVSAPNTLWNSSQEPPIQNTMSAVVQGVLRTNWYKDWMLKIPPQKLTKTRRTHSSAPVRLPYMTELSEHLTSLWVTSSQKLPQTIQQQENSAGTPYGQAPYWERLGWCMTSSWHQKWQLWETPRITDKRPND